MLRLLFIFSAFLLHPPLLADVSDTPNSSEALLPAKVSSSTEDSDTLKSHKNDRDKPPRIGNFALPASQQPSGLFAFGGNILDKGEVQIFAFADAFAGRDILITDLIPSVLFGVTDEFSLLFNFPVAPALKNGCDKSLGLEDFYLQAEYAFYNRQTACFSDQVTLLANVTVPTGSAHKKPPTGYGSPSFFVGGTYCHMRVDWFVFLGEGAILMTADRGTKIGSQFLYQFGFGRNLPSPEGWIYAWLCEIDGQYYQKSRFHGHTDRNSGGNVVFVTPSLWMSSKHFLLQFGVGVPVSQNWFGKQNKLDYALNFNCAWSFY